MSQEKQPVEIVVAEFNTDAAASAALKVCARWRSRVRLFLACATKAIIAVDRTTTIAVTAIIMIKEAPVWLEKRFIPVFASLGLPTIARLRGRNEVHVCGRMARVEVHAQSNLDADD